MEGPPGPGEFAVVADVAAEFAERVVEAFHRRGADRFRLALTGGQVAAPCYERLATHGETQIDWWQVELFLVDECRVPVEHEDSHERLVRLLLLDRVGAAHRVHSLRDAEAVRSTVEALGDGPLDLVHLVLGDDGRLSSLFPGASPPGSGPVVRTADPRGVVPHERLSISPEVLDRAGCILVTAVGASAAAALDAVRDGEDVPGARLPADRVVWLVDRAAAGS